MISTKKEAYNTYLIYSVLFILAAGLSFYAFYKTQNTMVIDPDGYLQHYPLLVKIRHVIKEVWITKKIPLWAWDTGLGADLIGNYAFELFDPFAYIPILLFKAENMDIGYTVGYIARMYACGLSFLIFYLREDRNRWRSIIGGLSYAFSAWAITSMMHAFFLYPMFLLPIIVSGINKVYRKQSPAMLIISVFMLLIFSWYFTYMTGVLLAIYAVIAYKDYGNEKFLPVFGRLFLCVCAAVLMSACIAFPTLYALLNASKDASTSQGFLHSIKSYLLLPASFFAENEIFWNYSATSVNGLFIAAIPAMAKRDNLTKTPVILWWTCLLFVVFPIFCRMLNGFSYPSGRWMFIMTFFYIWAGLEVIKSGNRITFIWLPFAAVIFIIDCLWLKILPEYNTVIFIVSSVVAITVVIINNSAKEISIGSLTVDKYLVLTAIVLINIIVVSNIRFLPSFGPGLDKTMKAGDLYKRAANSAQRIAAGIEDDSFFRNFYYKNPVDYKMMHVPMNDNAFWGTRSVYEYLSTLDHVWHDFNKSLCISAGYSQRVSVYGNDNRTRIDFLQGVKYYIGNETEDASDQKSLEEGNDEYAGYGYEKYAEIDGTEILKTDYFMGLGSVYNKVISRSEFEKLDCIEKEECLLQAAVIEDDDIAELSLSKVEKNDILTDSYTIESQISGDSSIVKNNGFLIEKEESTVDISFDSVKNSEVFIMFHNFRKRVPETEGIMAEKAYENFDITIKDGTRKKRICNYSGTNQAFNNIREYCVNMGYYDESPSKFTLKFNVTGEYNYDDIEIVVLPADNFVKQADDLINNRLEITSFDSTHIKGKTENDKDGLLYLSILENPGWRAKLNGKPVKIIKPVNIAFSGIVIPAGDNTIELSYWPPYSGIGLIISVMGLLLSILLCHRPVTEARGKYKDRQESPKYERL